MVAESQASMVALHTLSGHAWPSAGGVPQVRVPVVGSLLQVFPSTHCPNVELHDCPAASRGAHVALVLVAPSLQDVPAAQTEPAGRQSPPLATGGPGVGSQVPAQQPVTPAQAALLHLWETHSSPV